MEKMEAFRKFFLNKKGDSKKMYLVLIQLVVASAILYLLISYIGSLEEDTLFEKITLSRDLALLIDTIYGGPGQVNYEYSNNLVELDKFEFDFGNKKVGIKEIEDRGSLEVTYPYGEDLGAPYGGQRVSGNDKIILIETKDNLRTS